MDNDTLVEKLQKETIKSTLDNELDRELLLNDQVAFNNLLVGVILNKLVEYDTFEVYIYVKTTNKIACPFKYLVIKDEIKNKKIIENSTFDEILKALK